MVRISENSASKPGSLFGGLESGSGRNSHLKTNQLATIVSCKRRVTAAHSQLRSIL